MALAELSWLREVSAGGSSMKRRKQIPHGTVSGYNYWGCRCDKCQDARREYYGMESRIEYLARVFKEHGARAYVSGRCRCDDCRAHSAEVRRAYRAAHPESRERENKKRLERYYRQKEEQRACRPIRKAG